MTGRKNKILELTNALKETQAQLISAEETEKRSHHLLKTKESEISSIKDHFSKLVRNNYFYLYHINYCCFRLKNYEFNLKNQEKKEMK